MVFKLVKKRISHFFCSSIWKDFISDLFLQLTAEIRVLISYYFSEF